MKKVGSDVLGFIEWNSRGRIRRIVHVYMAPNYTNTADRIATALRKGWKPDHDFNEYDVDWCNRDQCYYSHWTGHYYHRIYLNEIVGGGRRKFWAIDEVEFCRADGDGDRGELTPEQISDLGYDRIALETPPHKLTEISEIAEGCLWCDTCKDMLPTDIPCRHQWWCRECRIWNTPGEECGHDRVTE